MKTSERKRIEREREKIRRRVYGMAGAMYAANAMGDYEMVMAFKRKAAECSRELLATYPSRKSTDKESYAHAVYISRKYDLLYGKEN